MYKWGEDSSPAQKHLKGRIHGTTSNRSGAYAISGSLENQLQTAFLPLPRESRSLKEIEDTVCDEQFWKVNKICLNKKERSANKVSNWVRTAFKQMRQDLSSTGNLFKWRSSGKSSKPGFGGTWSEDYIKAQCWQPRPYDESNAQEGLHKFFDKHRLAPTCSAATNSLSLSDKDIVELATAQGSCILIATDGGREEGTNELLNEKPLSECEH